MRIICVKKNYLYKKKTPFMSDSFESSFSQLICSEEWKVAYFRLFLLEEQRQMQRHWHISFLEASPLVHSIAFIILEKEIISKTDYFKWGFIQDWN